MEWGTQFMGVGQGIRYRLAYGLGAIRLLKTFEDGLENFAVGIVWVSQRWLFMEASL